MTRLRCAYVESFHGVKRLPLATRWQWSTVAMETLHSSCHYTHRAIRIISPLTLLPFRAVQQIVECQSAMWVGEGAQPGSALLRLTDQVLSRERWRRQCGGVGKKML